eukprot:TRINITY_DN21024_c3_g1_i1.p1 TRINITY_DN21024_c3_g1~~TRINITY_DN21024_c3_g1_i1.p1  ORF type:complete len:343 (-),score=78.09 TRINITY_DN21024_c3_g1_i1:228-1163(-)
MAVAFSNYSLSFPLPTPSKILKTLKVTNLTLNPLFKSKSLGSQSLFSSPIARPTFKPSLKYSEFDPETIDGEATQISEKKSEGEIDQKHRPTIKALIQVYKKAILDEDEKTITDTEALIYVIENEKNGLAKNVEELLTDITTGKEKLLRLKADFDNFRKRTEKDQLTLISDAQGEVIESLLPMVDNFERAKQQIKPGMEKEKKIDTSYQGIYKQFVEIMKSLRVAVVETVGKPFDPSLHEAIAREESQEFKEGIIIQEVRRGFVLGDQLLRPAKVKVSAGPAPKKATTAPESSMEQSMSAAGSNEGSLSNR